MKQTIGSCSLCGGAVTTYTIWHGIFPPPVTCENCGSHAAPTTGPVIPMTPAPRYAPQPVTTGTPVPQGSRTISGRTPFNTTTDQVYTITSVSLPPDWSDNLSRSESR